MEQIEKQFINSYLSILAKEGKEICKEVESIFNDNDELIKGKAMSYCQFISLNCDDKKLVERCHNYIENVNNFNRFESTFKKVNYNRKERESWLNMRNMRI